MKVIKCAQCSIELNGSFCNTPDGAFCRDCWQKQPKEVKDKARADILKGLSMLAKQLLD